MHRLQTMIITMVYGKLLSMVNYGPWQTMVHGKLWSMANYGPSVETTMICDNTLGITEDYNTTCGQ